MHIVGKGAALRFAPAESAGGSLDQSAAPSPEVEFERAVARLSRSSREDHRLLAPLMELYRSAFDPSLLDYQVMANLLFAGQLLDVAERHAVPAALMSGGMFFYTDFRPVLREVHEAAITGDIPGAGRVLGTVVRKILDAPDSYAHGSEVESREIPGVLDWGTRIG